MPLLRQNDSALSEDFDSFMLAIPSLELIESVATIKCFSITIPHKEVALACCDEVDPVAKVHIMDPLVPGHPWRKCLLSLVLVVQERHLLMAQKEREQRVRMILANTTSIGMQPKVEETPVPKEALRHFELVFDAVYTPKITRLLREAEEMGAKIVTGVEMFLGQAYEQYERFTGLPAPKQLFKDIVEDR
ncbi:Bifunctional 3-dehydroquinate dehydratase/shikimate dehydrogenase, chloroplastic [Sesamum angolense]|uniref:Bifunctional 3-dehydroquinate dehydratase/shikimate dehydrogenase, chloroplastic n=1 Tax=Sesamum angolense TaxID=2727404 RepID=A0AAE1W810_9LAMI|nr:Bifunctional 3-dehydroquinate dehydratase/shikimate dehydrogenase, chloroplastic [Sesamum angolense]